MKTFSTLLMIVAVIMSVVSADAFKVDGFFKPQENTVMLESHNTDKYRYKKRYDPIHKVHGDKYYMHSSAVALQSTVAAVVLMTASAAF